VTGEVVGQVASQTMENLTSIDQVVSMPVLRPLIGMDKDEITAEAQRLQSFPISIIPDQDCCTLFTPRHPVTRAKHREVMAAEASLDIDEIVKQAVAGTVVEEFEFP
jgi:thiamine biosynthesis protein ThiI